MSLVYDTGALLAAERGDRAMWALHRRGLDRAGQAVGRPLAPRHRHIRCGRYDERTQQRLADSYLEVLRLVEREARWFEASTKNVEIYVTEYDYQLDLPHVELPERTITDRATIAAHLAGYGSTNVRT